MATTKILARDFDFHLNTGTIGVPVWTEINGINSWSHSPTGNDADTTTFDEDGRMSHLKASRGDSFTLDGLYLTDVGPFTRDAGQAAIAAWADEIGPDSLKQFRITNPDTTTLVFLASATVTAGGGGNDDPAAFTVNLTVSGAVTNSGTTAKPAAVTSVVGTALTDAASVTWTDGSGSPYGYEVTAYDDADDSVVATINTDTKPAYFSGLTTGDDIYFKVRARNSAGLGVASAESTPIEIL
jgi:hypothetical protein